ncbi:MAG: CoA ester lyase, partial [Pseudomonadota bacterium]
SMLFLPANNKRYIQKARTVLADAIIFDMEDILPEHKAGARELLIQEFKEDNSFGYSEKVLRLNDLGSEELSKDLELLKQLTFDSLLFPHIETPEQVLEAEAILNSVDSNLEFMINIESPLGVLNAQQICAASESLKCIVIGTNNLSNRLQINIKKSTQAILGYLSQIALAARAYNKIVIDGPHYNVRDEFSCEASTKLAFQLGFDGKALIHPIQIEYINDIFTPKKADVEKAIRMLGAYENALKKGKEVIMFEDELVDKYQVKWSQRMITLYDKYKELGQDNFI